MLWTFLIFESSQETTHFHAAFQTNFAFIRPSVFVNHRDDPKNQVDNIEFFSNDNFLSDTLFIKSRFMECGEWGGHLELSKVYLRDNDFYITYQKYSADCNSIKENNGEPIQTLIKTITKILMDKDKLLIRRYFHQLIDAKFREPSPMHAGYIFEINKTDKSINLSVYTWGVTTRNEYLEFVRYLFE